MPHNNRPAARQWKATIWHTRATAKGDLQRQEKEVGAQENTGRMPECLMIASHRSLVPHEGGKQHVPWIHDPA